jgi:archaellum component FlaG (FlaF/FlaG flagellin family)
MVLKECQEVKKENNLDKNIKFLIKNVEIDNNIYDSSEICIDLEGFYRKIEKIDLKNIKNTKISIDYLL